MSERSSYPDDRRYHADHAWAQLEGGNATFGITWYAQDALGEIVFFGAPEVGTLLTRGEPYAELESVKALAELVSPLSGEVTATNAALRDNPQAINADPYGDGWLVRVELSERGEPDRLLDAAAYAATLHEAAR